MFYETMVLLVSVVASLLTYELNIKMAQGAVKASAIVGLLFGLPVYFAPAFGIAHDILWTVPAAAIGASFAGMSSEKVITNRKWMLLTGAIFSGVFLFSSPVFAGNGGSLGTIACAAVVITLGIKNFVIRNFL